MRFTEKILATVKALLPRNRFARGVGVLVGGTAGSQLLMVLAAPLLTRLYTPEEFGLLAVFMGILAMFAVIASLRYEGAIPLPEDDHEAVHVTALCVLAVLLVTLVGAALVFLAGSPVAALLGAPALSSYFWLLPVGICCQGLYQVFTYWALRRKNFSAMAHARLKQAVTTVTIQLSGSRISASALLVGYVTGLGIAAWSMGRSAMRTPEFRRIHLAGILNAARRYRRFPIYSTWSGLFNTAGSELPPLMFAMLFSPAAAGLYALTHRILAMPMSVIGTAISNVFLANAADAHREGRLGPLVTSVHEKLAHIAMPPTLVFLMAGPQLFAFVFGESWREAGVFAQWMAPWLYVTFITAPLSTLFIVLEKQRHDLLFETLLLVVRLATLIIGGMIGDLMLTVALFSYGSLLCWAGFLVWITLLSGNPVHSLIKPTLTALAWSLLCVAPLVLGLLLLPDNYRWMLALAVTSILIGTRYYFLLRQAYL